MIELVEINKSFNTKAGIVSAVKDVTLTVETGEIYGIIGHSGAGKSTLVRCINLLERPETGQVRIEGEDITQLPESQLRKKRLKIGMIFQQFNLLRARTVFENVAFPLQYRGINKEDINQKVLDLLQLVGLSDKARAYPSQLSGGQKQRVAIARALANDPTVLLCDEATSALDPQTTQSILTLLKDLNQKLKLTIVIITHEMQVVKSICDKVAVMEGGRVVEEGTVLDVFVHPQENITKEFIGTVSNLSKVEALLGPDTPLVTLSPGDQLIRLDFHGNNTKEAILSELTLTYGIKASIIFADVDVIQATIVGTILAVITGDTSQQAAALEALSENQIGVEVLKIA